AGTSAPFDLRISPHVRVVIRRPSYAAARFYWFCASGRGLARIGEIAQFRFPPASAAISASRYECGQFAQAPHAHHPASNAGSDALSRICLSVATWSRGPHCRWPDQKPVRLWGVTHYSLAAGGPEASAGYPTHWEAAHAADGRASRLRRWGRYS